MSKTKFFRIQDGKATAFTPKNEDFSEPVSADSEWKLKYLCKNNLETLLDVRFLDEEFYHLSRYIDTLGLDKENRLVIIEYKKGSAGTVVYQAEQNLESVGIDDWLLIDKVEKLASEKLGNEVAQNIDWKKIPRLICIARQFSLTDMKRQREMENLELIRYEFLDKKKILRLEWISEELPSKSLISSVSPNPAHKRVSQERHDTPNQASDNLLAIYEDAKRFCAGLGDDVHVRENKQKMLFFCGGGEKFANLALRPKAPSPRSHLRVYMNLDTNTLQKEIDEGFVQIVKKKRPRIKIYDNEQLERAKLLLNRSYEETRNRDPKETYL